MIMPSLFLIDYLRFDLSGRMSFPRACASVPAYLRVAPARWTDQSLLVAMVPDVEPLDQRTFWPDQGEGKSNGRILETKADYRQGHA
jgi:hypothetical protein